MKKDGMWIITEMKKLKTAYDQKLSEISTQEDLTLMEVHILGFLVSYPGFDTARDIEIKQVMKKSNISTALENLINRGLVERKRDDHDRRIIHLRLTDASNEITKKIEAIQESFFEDLTYGVSDEELQTYITIQNKLISNIERLK